MRVLVVYCHPVETSFHAALHQEVLRNLRAAGHEVDDCDLYAEGFDPVLLARRAAGLPRRAEQPAAAAGATSSGCSGPRRSCFCFPTWCFGLPAMLKGYFDRLLMPGVAFDISDPANVQPMLTHIKRISPWSPMAGRAGWRCTWATRRARSSRATCGA